MKLSKAQVAEVRAYIITVPKYRETLFDHVLNALVESKAAFSIDEVAKIINKDFGGFSHIVAQEKLYQQKLMKKYNVIFRQEMLNTFKWPEILNNLIIFGLCMVFYYTSESASFNPKSIFLVNLICCAIVTIFGLSKILRNRFKYLKYSILDPYLAYSCTFGLVMGNALLQVMNNSGLFEVSSHTKLITTLSLFFFCSIYVRAFIKFYNQKFSILTLS